MERCTVILIMEVREKEKENKQTKSKKTKLMESFSYMMLFEAGALLAVYSNKHKSVS